MIWSYLRRKARESLLAGFNDALGEVEGTDAGDTAPVVLALRARLAPALPAPTPPAAAEPSEPAADGPSPRKRRGEAA